MERKIRKVTEDAVDSKQKHESPHDLELTVTGLQAYGSNSVQHQYPIGNRIRSRVHILVLLTVPTVIIAILWHVLAQFDSIVPFLLPPIIIVVVLHRAASLNGAKWAVFIMKDSAYGRISDSGIEYRTLFGSGSVKWSQIDQVDFDPYSGRISIYLHDRLLPIQFGPNKVGIHATDEPTAISVLRRQVQTAGGVFVRQR